VRADMQLDLLVPYLIAGLNRIPDWYDRKRHKDADIQSFVSSLIVSGVGTRKS
jgi:hypothetical protein